MKKTALKVAEQRKQDNFVKAPEKAFEVVLQACRKHGLDAEDLIRMEGLSPLEYVDSLVIEARQKNRLINAVFENNDFISEISECPRYPELMAVKDAISDITRLLNTAVDLTSEFV